MEREISNAGKFNFQGWKRKFPSLEIYFSKAGKFLENDRETNSLQIFVEWNRGCGGLLSSLDMVGELLECFLEHDGKCQPLTLIV